jgi:hypothetical protein
VTVRDKSTDVPRPADQTVRLDTVKSGPTAPDHSVSCDPLELEFAASADFDSTPLSPAETPTEKLARLTDFLVESINRARASESPFYHLQFDRVFPDDIYAAMLREMPANTDYRALPGRDNVTSWRTAPRRG